MVERDRSPNRPRATIDGVHPVVMLERSRSDGHPTLVAGRYSFGAGSKGLAGVFTIRLRKMSIQPIAQAHAIDLRRAPNREPALCDSAERG